MKLCRDCKHYKSDPTVVYDKCYRPEFRIELSRGTNELASTYKFCDLERHANLFEYIFFGNCGNKGRYWEAK